ncbi:MAG: sensor histidine kinase [Rhizobiaceae bacterium]
MALIIAAVLPLWLLAAVLSIRYALAERTRFEERAIEVARQVSLVIESELASEGAVLNALAQTEELRRGDLAASHSQALRLTRGLERSILLMDQSGRQMFNTQLPFDAPLPAAIPFTDSEKAALVAGRTVITDVFQDPLSSGFRVAVVMPFAGPAGEAWLLAMSVPTSRILAVMLPAVPQNWTVAVGDGKGAYVTRSQLHDQMTGQPGLPGYVNQVVGRSGTFTAKNFQGDTLLAGYYRSQVSNWFYTANILLSVVQAPLIRSLLWSGALALVALAISASLAFVVGRGFAGATAGLANRAAALGRGEPVKPLDTRMEEFASVADELCRAEQAITERRKELQAVLDTAPAAVWFTHDPKALEVIRNRYAARLMGISDQEGFDLPGQVVETTAYKDGQVVGREERPLTRAMRGEITENQEYTYVVLDGARRTLLTSARPILDDDGNIAGAVQVSLDISERKRAEEQRRLLVNELNHRVKNTLAVVQSVVSQTLRSAAGVKDADKVIAARLQSLARAHDLLTKESWTGATLADVMTAAVGAGAPMARVTIQGQHVWLNSSLALSFAMIGHELTTNATKYGALCNETGRVSITWQVQDGRLTLEWRETGGPPARQPERMGFGLRMIRGVLEGSAGAKASTEFTEQGLVATFELDLPA